MAGLSARTQFESIAWLRWRVFVNGLRSKQRATEAISGVFMFLLMLLFGFGPAIGFAFGTYSAISTGDFRFVPVFFWITFFYWQFLPALSMAVSEVFDASTFLRFPVSLPVYYALWLAFGSLDPALVVPLLWLCGMFLGVVLADLSLIFWAALVLFTFALLNLLLSRLITAYIERWLAKRKTRELVGALLAFLGIGIQLISRLVGRYAFTHRNSPTWNHLLLIQQHLPPGIGARAIQLARGGEHAAAFAEWALLAGYSALFAAILGIRLRAQYRGENLSETDRRGVIQKRARSTPASRGWLALPDPIGVIFEKEIRTLLGARQLWISMIAPPLMLLVFGKFGTRSALWSRSEWTLPLGAAYGLMTLSAFFCNSFSGELGGIQLLYLAPVRFRQIMTGKNIAQALIATAQFLLLLTAVSLFFSPPSPALLALTVAGMGFGILANLTAGNLLSLYFPKKVDFARMNRQQGSSATGLIMLGLQLAIVALAAPVFLLTRFTGSEWPGVMGFLVLAAITFVAYLAVLGKVDSIALRKRETLIAEFTKAA